MLYNKLVLLYRKEVKKSIRSACSGLILSISKYQYASWREKH